MHITSSNPHDQPAIDPAYLSHEVDVEIFSKGIELCLKMVATSPFKEKIKRMYYPNESWDLKDVEQRKRYARERDNRVSSIGDCGEA